MIRGVAPFCQQKIVLAITYFLSRISCEPLYCPNHSLSFLNEKQEKRIQKVKEEIEIGLIWKKLCFLWVFG